MSKKLGHTSRLSSQKFHFWQSAQKKKVGAPQLTRLISHGKQTTVVLRRKTSFWARNKRLLGFRITLYQKRTTEWTIPYGFGHECSGSGELPYRLSCDSRYADTIMTGGANAYDMPAKRVNKPTLNFPLLEKGLKIMEC